MALTRRSDSKFIYLQAKHFCLWRELKKPVEGCEAIEVTNPKTGAVLIKHGFRFDSVSGHVVKLEKYDTAKKYATRYFGFKLHIVDGGDTYVLDMPYNSTLLSRFLRVARSVDWKFPLSITIFKGKKKNGGEETGIWFQQRGETVKAYYTKEQPHGMPEAVFYSDTQEWDFKAQHRWLVERLQTETVEDIMTAAAKVAPPIEHADDEEPHSDHVDDGGTIPPHGEIGDDDVPF